MLFSQVAKNVQTRYDELAKDSKLLFLVSLDKGEAWETYLGAFPEEHKQEHNCKCCKSFIKRYAGVVSIQDNEIQTLWDDTTNLDPVFADVFRALRNLIKSKDIKSAFFSEFSELGVATTYDVNKNINWEHFILNLNSNQVKYAAKDAMDNSLEQKAMFEKAESDLGFSTSAVDTVLELIKNNDLYRANSGHTKLLKRLREALVDISRTNNKELVYWKYCMESDITRVKNTSMGQLLNSLSAGDDLEVALGKYNAMVDPTKYQQNKGKVSSLTLKKLKAELDKQGYTESIKRRHANEKDIPLDSLLFKDRAQASDGEEDFFEELQQDIEINPAKLGEKATELSVEDFIKKVVPEAASMKFVHESRHLSNLVSLTGPEIEDSPSIFQWDNPWGWAYAGGYADAITQRVKKAGGKVDALLRVSLVWDNKDDLDLYLAMPSGPTIYHANMQHLKASAKMDVDENFTRVVEDPAENIYIDNAKYIKHHSSKVYKVKVHNYQTRKRGSSKSYTIQIAYKDQLVNIPSNKYPRQGTSEHLLDFKVDPDKGIILPPSLKDLLTSGGKLPSITKWGIETNKLVDVNMLTHSPNYWGDNEKGNKHYIFALDGCKADEDLIPFFNEQLTEDLRPHRQVIQALSEKAKIKPCDNQVSGVGFSSTKKADFLMQVEDREGAKRVYKVKVAS